MTQLTDEDRARMVRLVEVAMAAARDPERVGPTQHQADMELLRKALYEDGPHIAALLSAARTQSQVEGWEPIETAPRDGEELLVWGMSIGRRVASAKDVPRHEPYEWPGGWDFPTGATHWRPLPAPPASQTQPADTNEIGDDPVMGPAPKRGEIRVIDGQRLRFIERELEGDKWEVLGPASQTQEG